MPKLADLIAELKRRRVFRVDGYGDENSNRPPGFHQDNGCRGLRAKPDPLPADEKGGHSIQNR